MSTKNQHIIHRQILDLEMGAGLSDADIREKYQDELAVKMRNVMDSVFGELSPEEELLLIDKLEIDLGDCSSENLLPKFESMIRRQLQEMLGKKQEQVANKRKGDEAKKISASRSIIELFTFFLEKSHFPWWAEKTDLKKFEELLLEQLEKEETKADELFNIIQGNTNAAKRLSRQFSFIFNLKLLKKLHPGIIAILEEILKFLPDGLQEIPGISITPDKQDFESILMESVWSNIPEPGSTEDVQNFREIILAEIILKLDLPAGKALKYFEKSIKLVPEEVKKLLKEKAVITTTEPEIQEKNEKKLQNEVSELLVENAGIIILWPFLQAFYEKMNLLDKKAFKSEKQQERAVLLTQYLVNEKTELHESQLVLNKILNNWPVNKPLESKLKLAKAERKLSVDFLKEIIENWQALKNSSPAALQETFLQRNGLLKQNKDSWNLRVERKSVDVLRDSLPWPVNIISLPWMDTIIYVKW